MHAAFETWPPPDGTAFDAVVAATAWHWADPDVRYRRAWELLRPGGHLAFWAGDARVPGRGGSFFRELQAVYDEIGAAGRRVAAAARAAGRPGEILASGLFDRLPVTQFDWELRYDAESYVELLETFSANISMQPWQRERLYAEIRARVAERPDGRCAGTGGPRCTWPGGPTTRRLHA